VALHEYAKLLVLFDLLLAEPLDLYQIGNHYL
jgi:hypothetical protein